MMPRTPNYVLTEDYTYSNKWSMYGPSDMKTLPEGSYIRPIELCYVPKHVIDNPAWKNFNAKTEMFCYTNQGMIPIPKNLLRET